MPQNLSGITKEKKRTSLGLPSVLEVHGMLSKSGKAGYLDHIIRVSGEKQGEDGYIIEGPELKYCEFRRVGLALILIYLQRMLLVD